MFFLVMRKSSFLVRRKPQEEKTAGEVLLGVNVSFKLEGEDLVISAKVRTRRDLERLKNVINEMIDELLMEHEEQRASTTSPRPFRK